MKGFRAVDAGLSLLALLALLVGISGAPVRYSASSTSLGHDPKEEFLQQRSARGVGFPSFFYDIKHQFGSIGADLRKLVTSLMGATQVVYWKQPIQRIQPAVPVRRVDYSHRHQTASTRHPARVQRVQPPPKQRRPRRKQKSYTGDDYDDFFSFDAFGLW